MCRWHWRGTLAAAAVATLACLVAIPADADTTIRRGFVENRFGQLHYRIVEPAERDPDLRPLVLFHSSPLSSVVYRDLMKAVDDRVVIAVDTPGFGHSDPPPGPPSMAELADGVADGLRELGPDQGGTFDLFGRLTGSIVALELAARSPELVGHLVLAAVPYFSGDAQAEMYQEYAVGYNQPVPEDGSHLDRYWQSIVAERAPGVSMTEATELFLDLIRAKPVHWWGYHAVFTHDSVSRVGSLTVPVILLEYENPFRERERLLANDLADVTVIELADHDRSLTGAGAERLAAGLQRALPP